MERGTLALIKSAIDGSCAVLPADTDLGEMFYFAKTHKLLPLLYYGVTNSNIDIPTELQDVVEQVMLSGIITDQHQQHELLALQASFEENAIDYMPIKGILLKPLYPHTEARPMGDGDILIRLSQRAKIESLMDQLGYQLQTESPHELVYCKKGICVELHKCLIPPYNKDYYAYYGDGWRLAEKCDAETARYEMSAENHFIYMFTHFAKHYRDGGIGVLHLVDFWVYTRAKDVRTEYVRSELAKLGLQKFYDNVMKTVDAWFNGAAWDDMTDFITHRMFSHGEWGTENSKRMATAARASTGASAKGIETIRTFRTLFPGLEDMQKRYPLLKKHKYLLPFLWVARWFDVLLFKRDRLRNKVDELKLTTEENVSAYQAELNYVGLDFNFKE